MPRPAATPVKRVRARGRSRRAAPPPARRFCCAIRTYRGTRATGRPTPSSQGRLDFYGDFRIGAPLGIVGGFNPYLGFATTNNDVDNGQVYALAIDPTRLDHYVLDGVSVPLGRELVTRRFHNGAGYGFETRERVFTDLGPVIHRDHGRIYRSP